MAGCGDLGERVGRLLLKRGDQVVALRRHPPAEETTAITWLGADLTRADTLLSLPTGITQLVYLPAPGAREQTAYRAIYVDGLRNLLNALDRTSLQRVLFVSSSAVYGEHAGAWVDESTPTAPLGFNGEILLEAERWLLAQPLRAMVLRLAGLYGPGRMQWVERLRAGQMTAPRAPTHWANRMHVDDAAAAVVHLLGVSEPESLYLGADDTPQPLDELYDYLAALIGASSVPEGPAPAGVGSKRLNNARLLGSGFRCRWPDAREGYADAWHASR